MLSGIHLPNTVDIAPEDLKLVVTGRFQAAKLMPYHLQDDVLELVDRGVHQFIVRLPDSVAEGGRIKGDVEYAVECESIVDKFYAMGITDFQLDNEPNLTWASYQPPHGQSVEGVYAWFLGRVFSRLRARIPSDVRIGLPPLSWTALSDEGKAAWLSALKPTAQQCSFITVNSYWQSLTGTSVLWEQFGGNAIPIHNWLPGKPIVVGEYGSSVAYHPAQPTPETVQTLMARQYPLWLQWSESQGYISAAYLYLLGGTPDWAGFRLSGPVASAIAARPRTTTARAA